MTFPEVWTAPQWLIPFIIVIVVASLAVGWSYVRCQASVGFRLVVAFCKITGFVLLGFCLLEPVFTVNRPRSGANLFMILADSSQSLQIRDQGQNETREEQLRRVLTDETQRQEKLEKDFDLRRYEFDRQLRSSEFVDYVADGVGSSIVHSLKTVADRYQGRPNAGIMMLTDGNATDTAEHDFDWTQLPPIYPVIVGNDRSAKDISISRFSVSQSNFETAPVSIFAEIRCQGYSGKTIKAQLLDNENNEVDQKVIAKVRDNQPFAVRFQLKTKKRGINAYRVRVFEEANLNEFADGATSAEATLVNNERLVLVDRARGPYRVLYVAGRPNWEFKFLQRAIGEDDEIELVGLLRIAKKEPKFTFRGHLGEKTNPLFRGFGNQDDEQAEQYDEPVLIRLGVNSEEELRDGFPKSAEELYQYDAIVLDDVEADFFNQDQKSLIQQFVSARGGGLLMLGGQESFEQGKFDRTPIGELLPVYLDRGLRRKSPGDWKLELTREGWLQPWVRIESTEEEETTRLEAMPGFKTINPINSIKPGASVLARVKSADGQMLPALVVQRFGKGRSSAILIGDMWRWHMKAEPDNDDLMKAWRQTIRWLVADVPRRVDAEVSHLNDANLTVFLKAEVNDEMYRPLDNARVDFEITKPDGIKVQLTADPLDTSGGQYGLQFVPRQSGAYTVNVTANSADGQVIDQREIGWVSEPAVDEFQSLQPNAKLMQKIADQTGGEVVQLRSLDRFVADLPSRKVPFMETKIVPWWHNWTVFLVAVGLLVVEWGMRRWRGLP